MGKQDPEKSRFPTESAGRSAGEEKDQPRFGAVIFDLDGTLLDTLEDLGRAMNAALLDFGYPPHPLAAYKRMVGNGLETLVVRALPTGADKEPSGRVEALTEAMRAIYQERAMEATRVYPGICRLLAAVRAMGLKSGVLTNKPDPATQLVLRHFFPSHTFTAVQGARQGTPLKPDPTSALTMAEEFALRPERILYLGDSDVDMQTAKAAGMYAVGAVWGFRTAEELLASGADALCAHPQEVAALLTG
ncbi:MAG: HAD family hydrolase [Desulfovibrio sp.]|jgi:phosphoglycolate phosphatase|nr:HAD family hydrolase [Desulfovibrio sp.]